MQAGHLALMQEETHQMRILLPRRPLTDAEVIVTFSNLASISPEIH